ncbi:MAG: hypothetical protein ACSLE6_00825 [Mycobacterium sp.]
MPKRKYRSHGVGDLLGITEVQSVDVCGAVKAVKLPFAARTFRRSRS